MKINSGRKINFGQRSASDYTIHKSPERKDLYIQRHERREHQFWDFDNVVDNIETASFWSRYLLWEKSDIFDAIKNIEEKAKCKIIFTPNTIMRH